MDSEVATVLPRELRLGVPPTMPQARSYLFRQQSTRSSPYDPSNTIQINIPRLQRSYLRKDSYLRFTVDLASTNASYNLTLDSAGAFGFFEKIEVFDYLGSTVLESISGVPQLAALLLDLGMETMVNNTVGNALAGLGTETASTWSINFNDTAALTQTYTTSMGVRPPSFGRTLEPHSAKGDDVGTNATAEFAIPLISFLGWLSKKMVPLHNGFTIMLTLASQATPIFAWQQAAANASVPIQQGYMTVSGTTVAGVSAAATDAALTSLKPTWQVRDVYMTCQILELGPVAESMLLSSSQGQPLIVHTKSFRNYTGTISNTTPGTTYGPSEWQLQLNLNVASLTNVFWFMRDQSQLNVSYLPSVGQRTRNFLSRWWFQYGSTSLPQNNGIICFGQNLPSSTTYYTADTTGQNVNEYNALCLNATEGYQELMKARPVTWGNNRLDLWSYCSEWCYGKGNDPSAGAVITGLNLGKGVYPSPNSFLGLPKFACGLNLELCSGKQGDLVCGLNTNGMNTSIRAQFHPSFLKWMQSCQVDAYAEYDAFINISPGIATTVSF